jgi:hypothetical protein
MDNTVLIGCKTPDHLVVESDPQRAQSMHKYKESVPWSLSSSERLRLSLTWIVPCGEQSSKRKPAEFVWWLGFYNLINAGLGFCSSCLKTLKYLQPQDNLCHQPSPGYAGNRGYDYLDLNHFVVTSTSIPTKQLRLWFTYPCFLLIFGKVRWLFLVRMALFRTTFSAPNATATVTAFL